MDQTSQTINAAGRGLSELAVPGWVRWLKRLIWLALFALLPVCAFYLDGWHWVTQAGADGFSPFFASVAAVIATAGLALPLLLSKSGLLNWLLNLRPSPDDEQPGLVFGGFRNFFQPLLALLVAASLLAADFGFVLLSARSCPLPETLSKVRVEVPAPNPEDKMLPIYFWDYATWVDPKWMDHINLVVPYEKGLPQKLLPKIFFEDSKSHAVVLELHGKRPRSYSQAEIWNVFDSKLVQPHDWPLVWRLEREAGLTTEGLHAPILYLLRLSQGDSSRVTQAIGVPWSAIGAAARPENGHVFFWGPDGAVFQVKCQQPCELSRLLELVQFPDDPKGSRAERLEWTKNMLKKLLDETRNLAEGPDKIRQENLLSLYLVSMLTLDPRDPEAFFHLGKIARNRETLFSAIRYAKDLGLEHAQVMELESMADHEAER